MRKTNINKTILVIKLLTIVLINFPVFTTQINAQTVNQNQTTTKKQKRQRVTYKPPNRGKPKKREIAASYR
jgi:hypothetical protein